MELRHPRSFVAVAEELHFGRAAAVVNPGVEVGVRRLTFTDHVQALLNGSVEVAARWHWRTSTIGSCGVW